MKYRRFLTGVVVIVLFFSCVLTPAVASAAMDFKDINPSDYFYDAVNWAISRNITKGTTETTFTPSDPCTRGQAVTFLWRTKGSVKVTGVSNPFSDVKEADYYYDAVLWAYSNHITSGMTEKSFGPSEICNRGQIVTFLWSAEGMPHSSVSVSFNDVPKDTYYYEAVRWAVEKGITKGTSDVTFSPGAPCTRAQIVTFLYRYFSEGTGNDAMRQIEDINGRVVDIPKNIQSIAAPGELALIVEMLGGGSKLQISSASLMEGLAGKYFGSEWSGSVFWNEDGSSPMSDDRFKQLLKEAPQLCMMLSGKECFSEDQLLQLKENDIAYITLPALTSTSRICEAVRISGEVLQAQDEATAYINYCNEMKKNIRGMTETFRPDGIDYGSGAEGMPVGKGVYSLYISGWDESVSYSLRHESVVLSGQGMAVTETGYVDSPVTEMLSLAGIGNSAVLQENNSVLNKSQIRLINPLINNLCSLDIQGGRQGAIYNKEYVLTTAGGWNLGDYGFPAVIAGTKDAYDGIIAEKNRRGLWGEYPETQSPSGNTYDYGFLDGAGNLVVSTIHDHYDLYLVPSGAGSWSGGSVESILLPHWAAWRVRGIGSEAEVRSRIFEFYQRFYNVHLSETDIDVIMAGTFTK